MSELENRIVEENTEETLAEEVIQDTDDIIEENNEVLKEENENPIHTDFIEHIPEADKTVEEEVKEEEPQEKGHAKAILEGLLFIVGDDGISLEQASQALGISQERTAQVFDELMQDYLDDAHGIEIANYGGTYRFLSKALVHEYAKTLFQINKNATLSQAALETLAIIAYKQPITRVEIEELRGVGAEMMLRKLLARDLIKESGRSEAAGRPILYEVTEEFMNSFKLLSLNELPELPQFESLEESDDLFGGRREKVSQVEEASNIEEVSSIQETTEEEENENGEESIEEVTTD
ncbi:MAG: SMC-Scp complex subunit ScpB [Solobacterium sp.]|nr:SMC-Scp complex subunit ScpB [Solobacterium sp.]